LEVIAPGGFGAISEGVIKKEVLGTQFILGKKFGRIGATIYFGGNCIVQEGVRIL